MNRLKSMNKMMMIGNIYYW